MLLPVFDTDILMYCESRSWFVSVKQSPACVRVIRSKSMRMLPPRGVYFKAFDIRLLNILSTLSVSSHVRNESSSPQVVNVMFLLCAFTLNISVCFCSREMMSACFTFSFSVSFSNLLKSIIWFTSRSIRSTLRCTMCSRLLFCPVISLLSHNCVTGPAIMVSGVRNSCDMLAKKLMFILLIRCSCSFSYSARFRAIFSACMRILALTSSPMMTVATTIYIRYAHHVAHARAL